MLGDIDTIHIASQASMTRPMAIVTTSDNPGMFHRMSLPTHLGLATPSSPTSPTNPLSRTSSVSTNPSSPSFSSSFIGSFGSSYSSGSYSSMPTTSPIAEWHAKGKVPAIIRTLSKGLDPFR
jgi:hypothetical protein